MNNSSQTDAKPNAKKWQKIGWIVLLVLVVGYHFGRPTLEKLTGWSLPALNGGDELAKNDPDPAQNADGNESNESGAAGNAESDRSKSQETAGSDARNGNGEGSSIREKSAPKKKSDKGPTKRSRPPPTETSFPLKKIGRDRYLTPAGLIYAMGPRREHRIDHVMQHAKDNLSKPSHGVFDAKDKDDVLALVDKAYETIKKKKLKPIGSQRDREEFVVNMGTVIGYKGGQNARHRRNKKKLNRLKLILQDGNEVITAFPY